MPAVSLPSAEILWQLLDYDAETGAITWKSRPSDQRWSTRYALRPAGTIKRKRSGRPRGIQIEINRKPYYAHRLIWVMVHGELSPDLEVDHRDCNPLNNRIGNLRLATDSQQQCNSRLLRPTSTNLKGVRVRGGSFTARIKINGKPILLGSFPTAEQAHEAYCRAAGEMFGEFARSTSTNNTQPQGIHAR